jgi:hypothetical protein
LACLVCCSGGEASSEAEGPAAQAAAEEQAAKRLLPADAEAEGWHKKGEPLIFSGERLFEHINGGADIYNEYGFVTLVYQQYVNSDKAVSIEIYDMGDASGGFGIYSYGRHPTLSQAQVGGEGLIHSNGISFWRDRYNVDIRKMGSAEIFAEEFLSLANAIDQKIGTTADDEPPIMKLLPAEGMVARSAVFARGNLGISNQVYVAPKDLFGLEEGDEGAAIARYRLGRPEFSVIVAEYKDEAARSEAFARTRAHFLGAESTRDKEFAVTPMPGKHHAVREAGNRLVFVANADTEKNAISMLDRISNHLGAE